jgi:hypothetical protein
MLMIAAKLYYVQELLYDILISSATNFHVFKALNMIWPSAKRDSLLKSFSKARKPESKCFFYALSLFLHTRIPSKYRLHFVPMIQIE